MTWLASTGDALRIPLADRSVDLVVGSPPYCDARTYEDPTLPEGRKIEMGAKEWVDWMLRITAESLRVSKGAVVWVAAGVTRKRTYQPACEGLMWRWYDEGWTEHGPYTAKQGSSYRPVAWTRNGMTGSGGDQWFRHDWEFCMCFKRPGELPWADNKACGHPPKYKPGGAMSNRTKNGSRVNHTKRGRDGEMRAQSYGPPDIANPGSVLFADVGGGRIGHRLAHENEAPYPVDVPERFILSLCPPGGLALDPFMGSGTTLDAAIQNGRRAIGFDLRSSQADLTRRRILDEAGRTPRRIRPEPAEPAKAPRKKREPKARDLPGQLVMF